METNATQSKSLFTVKKILRGLAILLITFGFCPSFLVSCSGQTVNVSVMTAVCGVSSSYGDRITEPHPIMLICLILPIVMLVVLFSKKMMENRVAIVTLVSTVADFVSWILFRSSVKKFAASNGCGFKTTWVYGFNIVALLLIALFSALTALKKLSLESDMVQVFSGGGTQNALNQMTKAVNQMTSAVTQMTGGTTSNIGKKTSVIGYCQKCGKGIPLDCRFCTSCGTPVPESLILEAEEKKKVEEEAQRQVEEAQKKAEEEALRQAEMAKKEIKEKANDVGNIGENEELSINPAFCQQCGAKLVADALFCEKCGAKVN